MRPVLPSRPSGLSPLLLAAALALAATSCQGSLGEPSEPPSSDGGTEQDGGTYLPDGGWVPPDAGGPAVDGGTDAGLPNLCDYVPTPGPNRTLPPASDSRTARAIYDEFFGQYLPTYNNFGWEPAPWVTAAWVEQLHFPTPPTGLNREVLHGLFGLNPFNFRRPGAQGMLRTGDNEALFASTSDPLERLQRFDPTEWTPATASTYTRTATTDIMASQFWYRASTPELRPYFQRALELCPDCDDVYTPLSCHDLYKIIELRFARFVAGKVELSRVFKLIGVDCSGAIATHTQNTDWKRFGTIDGVAVTAKWRLELSGQIAQRYWQSDTVYEQLMPVLVRASKPAILFQYYDGRFDREAGQAGDPYQRAYNTSGDGQCLRDCHGERCLAGRNLAGYYYALQSDCTCLTSATPIPTPLSSSYHAAGACEVWPNGVYGAKPSTSLCPQ